ncbi:thiol reductant ABC exporter subunit CydC [Mycolicibacterium agri]|nr:thiol reductant ABC exporter subunit CydC [Mycolicibacterium agri]
MAHGFSDKVMRLRSGQLVTRLGGDVDELSDLLVRAVLPIAVAAVLGLAAVAAVAVMSPTVAVLLAICLLLAGALAPWLAGRAVVSSQRMAARQREARDVAAMTALDHADQLRVGGRISDVIADVAARQREWGDAEDSAARPAALAAAVQTLAIGTAVFGATLTGIGLANVAAPMTVAVLMLLPLSAFEATGSLPAAAVALLRARLATHRLSELITGNVARPERVSRQALSPGDGLVARSLVSGYSETVEVGPLDLELAAGARLAIVGPSGAGKTALLMTLAGLLPPRGGAVELGGVPIEAIAEAELRSRIAFFAEDAHIFATTVADNLRVARGDATEPELVDALARVGLAEWLQGLPDGLATVLVGGADALSAGQRRRLLLARALITTSPVVLLDEPTENLDAEDAAAFIKMLLAGDGGLFEPWRTVVVATHHLPAESGRLEISSGDPTAQPAMKL